MNQYHRYRDQHDRYRDQNDRYENQRERDQSERPDWTGQDYYRGSENNRDYLNRDSWNWNREDRPYRYEYPDWYNQDRRAGYDRRRSEGLGERVRRFFGMAPKGYIRSDERIREDVCDEIMRRGSFDPSDVEVKVEDSEVTLEGSVLDRNDKYEAERLADSVVGVKDVHNRLRINSSRTFGQGQGNITNITSAGAEGSSERKSRLTAK